jgi:hypothetical protein
MNDLEAELHERTSSLLGALIDQEQKALAMRVVLEALIASHPAPDQLRSAFDQASAELWSTYGLRRGAAPDSALANAKAPLRDQLLAWRKLLR